MDKLSIDYDVIITTVYRQVLGNAHVMDDERLVVAESQLRDGRLTVRDFVRAVAKSPLYYRRYFEDIPRYRAIEVNFKHLLGRAPNDYGEIAHHGQILDQGGFEAEIDSYLDSAEYEQAFGENGVPVHRGNLSLSTQTVAGFVGSEALQGGAASSSVVPTNIDVSFALMTRDRKSRAVTISNVSQILANLFAASQPVYQPTPVVAQETPAEITLLPKVGNSPTEWRPGASNEDFEVIIRAAYRQVLGNAHVMESERLVVAESQLRDGYCSVREFVRAIAKSDLYRRRFFDNCPRYRATELNFKHLLGRAPHDYSETFYHSEVLDTAGFEADIDTYIDSDEYTVIFGENTVPFWQGDASQVGQNLLGYVNSTQLQGSYSTSDKAVGTGAQVASAVMRKSPLGKEKQTDIKRLLADVLRPRLYLSTAADIPMQSQNAPLQSQNVSVQSQSTEFQALQKECQELEVLIAKLQGQLANLRPAAGLGIAVFGAGQADTPTLTGTTAPVLQGTESYSELQGCRDRQQDIIKTLRSQIADARRYEAVAGSRLNRWRNRSY